MADKVRNITEGKQKSIRSAKGTTGTKKISLTSANNSDDPKSGNGHAGAYPYIRIAELAYSLYEQEGYRHGRDLDHWLEAERRLLNHQA